MPYSVKKTARIKSGQSLKSNKINHTTAGAVLEVINRLQKGRPFLC